MQNYTHRTKPTEYILQQKKEIRRQTFSSAETTTENALYAKQAENRVNTRPSRTTAKYGAVNGVCVPFFFSAVKLKFCINQPLFLRDYALFRKKTRRYENKQEKAEGLRCFPSAAHSGRQRRPQWDLCDILKLLIKLLFRGCLNLSLADLGVALFTAKIAA